MVRSISSPPIDPRQATRRRLRATRAADPAPADLDGTLRAALIESRQRMKELLELSCDFGWETDANGLFSFVTGRRGPGPRDARTCWAATPST